MLRPTPRPANIAPCVCWRRSLRIFNCGEWLPVGRKIRSSCFRARGASLGRRPHISRGARALARAAEAAGLAHARPYDLRHSFASLLLHEGRSVIYVARQLGHDARLTLSRYGHVIDELEDMPLIGAETAIADARLARRSPRVPVPEFSL